MGRGGGLGVGLGLRGATAFLEGEGPGGGMAYSFIATLTNWPYYGLKWGLETPFSGNIWCCQLNCTTTEHRPFESNIYSTSWSQSNMGCAQLKIPSTSYNTHDFSLLARTEYQAGYYVNCQTDKCKTKYVYIYEIVGPKWSEMWDDVGFQVATFGLQSTRCDATICWSARSQKIGTKDRSGAPSSSFAQQSKAWIIVYKTSNGGVADYPESALWGKGGGGSGCNRGGGVFNSLTIARSPLHLRNDHTG